MSLRASLKVPKYGLFYFKSDRTTSIVPLNKIVKVISGDNVSNGSKVDLNYGGVTLEAEIIEVNGMYVFLTQMCISWLNTCLLPKWKKKLARLLQLILVNFCHYFYYPR